MTDADQKPAEDIATRHAREIQEIIEGHQDLARGIPEGHELVEIRGKCSRAIAEACRRHVAEAQADSLQAAELAKPAEASTEVAEEGKPADGRPAEPTTPPEGG